MAINVRCDLMWTPMQQHLCILKNHIYEYSYTCIHTPPLIFPVLGFSHARQVSYNWTVSPALKRAGFNNVFCGYLTSLQVKHLKAKF